MLEYENDLLSRTDVQRILKIGKNKSLDLFHGNYLPAFILGNSYCVRQSDLIDFIEKHVHLPPQILHIPHPWDLHACDRN